MEYLVPAEREAHLLSRLRSMLAQSQSRQLQARLNAAEIDGANLRRVAELDRLPILRKDNLREIQGANPPFGGLLGVPDTALRRMFQSPGPIYEPQGDENDYWRWQPALVAAGFTAEDCAIICFSYHLTPAGQMFDDGARSLGCTTIPAGIGNQEQQLQTLVHSRATAYIGLPSYLHALLIKAAKDQQPLALRKAFVAAEPLPPSLRTALEGFGLDVQQGYGTADVGCLAYECTYKNGMHLHSDVLISICDPSSGLPLPHGQSGEVVVTTLNSTYPLVRFGTGDLSALTVEDCPCGRTTPRLLGVQGRLGQGVKIRGLFVYSHQLEGALANMPGVSAWSGRITRHHHRDQLTVEIETTDADHDLVALLQGRLHDALKLRCGIEVVPAGTLANAPPLRDERVWE